MKQIFQDLKSGDTIIEDVPCPSVKEGHLLISTSHTLISAGTERMLVEFGKANLIDKARQQPDKVKMVIEKVKTDGLAPTIASVKSKLDQPLPMGYCNVGTVIEVGKGIDGFSVGDRVASNGNHAEVVCVPKNLCAKIPDTVSDEEAVFTVISSIALQGIRLVQPTLGEHVVVIGLGLIGLLTVQLLRAQGCSVLGIDMDSSKCELAKKYGADIVDMSKDQNPISAANVFSKGRGVDAVLITASTKSNVPMHEAATMCRKRGRIVLVGVVGLQLSRADFYEKELSFQVSCSYGPGRYDVDYEENGHDYPLGYVRWTEQRNFQAVLDLLADKSLNIDSLITHRFNIDQAVDAYATMENEQPMGIVLQFPDETPSARDNGRLNRTISYKNSLSKAVSNVSIGFIGAGNYATQVLIPAFSETQSNLVSISSSSGASGTYAAKKFNFIKSTTDTDALVKSNDVNTLAIVTRHDSHAMWIKEALKHGKHVFVEKPLAINRQQLEEVKQYYTQYAVPNGLQLMVGFNRRFSPQVVKMKSLLDAVFGPKSFIMTVNSGAVPTDHWTQSINIGGGRIIGEGCHFIDLLRFLVGVPSSRVRAMKMTESVNHCVDNVSFIIEFVDGSMGTVHYLASGNKLFPKERLEVFSSGAVLQLDNFRRLEGYGWPGFKKMNLSKQDKGNRACVKAFVDSVSAGGTSPISFDELCEVTQLSFDIVDQVC